MLVPTGRDSFRTHLKSPKHHRLEVEKGQQGQLESNIAMRRATKKTARNGCFPAVGR